MALKSSSSKKQDIDDAWGAPEPPARPAKVTNEWDDADELLENLGGGASNNVPKRNNNNADLYNEATRGS